jgi:type II secretory pathway pseudopilin PulG
MTPIRIPLRFDESRRRQRGLSLIGLLVVGALIVFGALLAMKVVPSALEYNAIRSAVTKVASAGGTTVRDYQVAFDRYAAVDDITSITGKDLVIEKRQDGQTVVSFQYEKRIPLFGPASLVIDYRGSAQ